MRFTIERKVLEELLNNADENDTVIEITYDDSIIASKDKRKIEELSFVKLMEPIDGYHYGYMATYSENSDTEKRLNEIHESLEILNSIKCEISNVQCRLLDLLIKIIRLERCIK